MLPTTSRKAFGRLAQLLPAVGLSALTPTAPSAATITTSNAGDQTAVAGHGPGPAVMACPDAGSDPVPGARWAHVAALAGEPVATGTAGAAGAATAVGSVTAPPDITGPDVTGHPAPVMSVAPVAGPRVVTVNATQVTEIDARTLHVEQGTIATTNEVHQVIQAGGDAHVSTPVTSAVVTASGHRAVAVTHSADQPADTRFGTGAAPPPSTATDTGNDTAPTVPVAHGGGPTGSDLAPASGPAGPPLDDADPHHTDPHGAEAEGTAGARSADGAASSAPSDASTEPDELLRSVQPDAHDHDEELTALSQLPDDPHVGGPEGGLHHSTVFDATSHGTPGHTPDDQAEGGLDGQVGHDVDHDG